MKKKIYLFVLVLCLLLSLGCTNTNEVKKEQINDKAETPLEARISELEDKIDELNKKNIKLDIKLYTSEKKLDFYKDIFSNMNKKADGDLKNKIAAATINPVFSIKEHQLDEEEELSIKDLKNNIFSVNLSYNIVDPELVNDYSLTFKRKLPYLDPENLLEIKTKVKHEIKFFGDYHIQKILITFKDVNAGDTISIVLSDELAKLCDYKIGSITINIVE